MCWEQTWKIHKTSFKYANEITETRQCWTINITTRTTSMNLTTLSFVHEQP